MPSVVMMSCIAFIVMAGRTMARSPDYNPFGAARYIMVVFYFAVLGGSAFIAWRNWQRDPLQRTAHHVSIWLMRVLAAGMWYQGTFWKVPLPVSDAFSFWVGALAKFTSFGVHASIVKAVLVPNIAAPASAGVPDAPSQGESSPFLKKRTKKLLLIESATALAKVFCFFSSEKKTLASQSGYPFHNRSCELHHLAHPGRILGLPV